MQYSKFNETALLRGLNSWYFELDSCGVLNRGFGLLGKFDFKFCELRRGRIFLFGG